jgi:hypothetical protein
MRRPSIFKKTDVTRATKAVRAAGFAIDRVEIGQNGLIVVVPGKPLEPNQDANVIPHKPPADLDRELEEFEARHGQG